MKAALLAATGITAYFLIGYKDKIKVDSAGDWQNIYFTAAIVVIVLICTVLPVSAMIFLRKNNVKNI